MKFTFIEKKMAPSGSLRAYAEKKVSKIDRLFRTESEANVTFSTERGRFTAEITIKNNGTFFRAHETTSDMYASVDSAVATIERQIRKNKTRLAKMLRDGAFEREVQPDFLPADDAAEAGAFESVRRKRFPIKPMSVEEAILQMDLLEHTFFVFRDVAADGAVSVVYRRKDGGYGLIDANWLGDGNQTCGIVRTTRAIECGIKAFENLLAASAHQVQIIIHCQSPPLTAIQVVPC